jgi:hypothetical protein
MRIFTSQTPNPTRVYKEGNVLGRPPRDVDGTNKLAMYAMVAIEKRAC